MLATFFAPVEKFNYEFTCFVNIKTSQLMCSANEDDCFCMRASVVDRLRLNFCLNTLLNF